MQSSLKTISFKLDEIDCVKINKIKGKVVKMWFADEKIHYMYRE